VEHNIALPQCDVDSFDSEQSNTQAICSDCGGNDATGACGGLARTRAASRQSL